MTDIRLVDTDLADPAFTAALDEVFLEGAGKGGPPTLHLYRRSPASVTLGYFLEVEDNVDLGYCRENGIKVVRRMSGGGAIYTDEGQLVYGLACKDILPRAPAQCFEVVCGALARALGSLGCDCGFSPINDVVAGGRKLSGSALVNRGAVKLVHGTIIVDIDREVMFRALRVPVDKVEGKGLADPGERVTSLKEQLGREAPMEDVKRAVVRAIGSTLGLAVQPGPVTDGELARAKELAGSKYGTDEWNLGK